MVAERKGTTVLDQFYLFNYYTMEKLLQLLNEYDKDSMRTEKSVYAHETGVISKKFWFIERLVENDKIILQKDIIRRVEYCNYGVIEDIHYYSAHKSILMYLAIQDEPISFLISILK